MWLILLLMTHIQWSSIVVTDPIVVHISKYKHMLDHSPVLATLISPVVPLVAEVDVGEVGGDVQGDDGEGDIQRHRVHHRPLQLC